MIIAIDGPAGSGKSTIAKRLAEKLKIEYIDSGAIYRTITLYGMRKHADGCQSNENEISTALKKDPSAVSITYKDNQQIMWLLGEDVSQKIRDLKVTAQVKYIADHPESREFVNNRIRSIAAQYSVVIDGRDIGTIVFPDTPYKFYLDAQPEERAVRRARELGIDPESEQYCELLDNINQRDKNDMERSIAPLQQAKDAYYLDTSNLDIEQVLEVILKQYRKIMERSWRIIPLSQTDAPDWSTVVLRFRPMYPKFFDESCHIKDKNIISFIFLNKSEGWFWKTLWKAFY